MRILLVAILLLLSTWFVPGQSPLARRAFADATTFANAGEFDKALKAYRVAATATGKDAGKFAVRLRYNLGVCYYQLGDLKAAKTELNAAIRLSTGQHQRAYYALGMTETALENWPAAKSAFLASLELAPHDGEAWLDLALVYLAEHDHDNAAAAFRKSIENKSVDAALGHNNLGVILALRFEYDLAEKAFRTALELSNGRLIEARTNLEFCRVLKDNSRRLTARVELNFARRTGGPGIQMASPA